MRVWIFEDNLLWSARLAKSLQALGHEGVVLQAIPTEGAADAAIVNLGSAKIPAVEIVPQLKARGVFTIGHAGHKEKDLLALGREAGCDKVATNSELTYKIENILEKATQQK
jgi:hypothetical protein